MPASNGTQAEGEKTTTPPALPAPLEVKWAEDLGIPPDSAKAFVELAGKLNFNAPQAQAMADQFAALQGAREKVLQSAFEKRQAEWATALKADPDIGGEKFDASRIAAQRAVAKFGGKELIAFLEQSGAGNHPALVRAFVAVGRAMREDSIAGGTGSGAAPESAEAFHQQLYPTMFKKE